jgi:MFS family permease
VAEITSEGKAPVGYFALVRDNRNFRSIWLGQVVSLLGDWFNLIASAALVSSLTSSGLAVGGLFVVRMLAPFLVSPLAGVAADRFNRKQLLILTDLARAAIVLGFLFVRDPGHVWLLYTLTAAQLAISGFFFPARNAILPDVVARREIGAANALSSSTWSVMLAIGAALGGVVAGEWGIYPAFVVDSLTFLLSAFFIAQVRYHWAPHPPEPGQRALAGLQQYIEGLRYLKRNRDVLAIALHKGAVALTISGVFQVIQVTLAERVFVIGEGGGTSMGLLYAVAGVGTGLGPLVARRFTGDDERLLRISLALSYAMIVAGIVIAAPLSGFGAVLFGTFVRGFGGGVNWVFSTQLLLHLVPNQVRGRVFSSEFALFTLGSALSSAIGGWVLDSTAAGLSGVLWGTALLTCLPGLLWFWWITGAVSQRTIHREGAQDKM